MAIAVLLAAVALAVVDSDAGIATWAQLRAEADISRHRVSALEREVAGLEEQVEALRTDPSALEWAIREDLEMVRPGEWVVRFSPSSDPTSRFP